MKIKVVFILFFTVSCTFNLISQSSKSQIDSIMNAYDRQYRVKLNDSDFKLIADQLGEIGSDCKMLDTLLESNLYSNNYKIALLSDFKYWMICSNTLLNSVSLMPDIEDDQMHITDVFSRNFPIYQTMYNNEDYRRHFVNYIEESDYLDDCDFLWKHSSIHMLKMLSSFIQEVNLNDSDEHTCKNANITILQGISIFSEHK